MLLGNISQAQCAVTVTPSVPPSIICGETLDLVALGTGSGGDLNIDFNNSTTSIGWTNSQTISYSNPCGPTPDGTPAAWFGNVGAPRTLTSTAYDFSCGGEICFDFDFANDDPCGGCDDCEDPDQINEGVYFQYSIDGGATWVDIFYFQPNNTGTGPYYTWNNHCFTVPPAAQTANTMFQWHQNDPTSALYDHWGIDNIVLTPYLCGGGYYYEWNGILGDEDTTVTLNTTTTYDILFTNGVDDSCTTSITVDVAPFNVVAVPWQANITCGDCISLFGQLSPQPSITGASFDIAWTPASLVTNSTSMFTDACPLTDTTVIVTITETTTGCVGADTVIINVTDLDPSFAVPTQFCADDPVATPNISGTAGGAFTSTPGLVFDPVTGEIDPGASTPGTYDLTYTPSPNCPTDSTVSVVINDLPIVDAGPDAALCFGESITLNGAGANNYTWDNGVVDGVAFAPNNTLTYTVTGTDLNGCENTDQVTVTVNPADDPSFIYDNGNEYCIEDVNPQAIIQGTPGGLFSYMNITGTNLNLDPNTGNIDLLSSTPGQYTVMYNTTAAGLCPDSSTMMIEIHPMPDASFTADNTLGCDPQTITFTETFPLMSSTCSWQFGNGDISSNCGPVYTTYPAGLFDVSLTITSEAGCVSTVTYAEYIDITAVPNANFLANPSTTTVELTEIQFSNYSTDAGTYYWTFGEDSQSSAEENPTYIYPEVPQVYDVTLTATSDDGLCSNSTTSQIIINDVLTFFIPNTFTPNGDSYNNTFQPVFTSGFDASNFHLYIFNRWGEIMFESYDPTAGWDGTYPNGDLVPDGVYIWQVDFSSDASDERFLHRGHVTVLK